MKKKLALVILLTFLTAFAVLGFYLLIKDKELKPALWRAYIAPKKDWDDFIEEVVKDCYQLEEGLLSIEDSEHLALLNKSLGRKKDAKLLSEEYYYLTYQVPNTNTCWVYWMGDINAQGVVVYKTQSGVLNAEYVKNVPGGPTTQKW